MEFSNVFFLYCLQIVDMHFAEHIHDTRTWAMMDRHLKGRSVLRAHDSELGSCDLLIERVYLSCWSNSKKAVKKRKHHEGWRNWEPSDAQRQASQPFVKFELNLLQILVCATRERPSLCSHPSWRDSWRARRVSGPLCVPILLSFELSLVVHPLERVSRERAPVCSHPSWRDSWCAQRVSGPLWVSILLSFELSLVVHPLERVLLRVQSLERASLRMASDIPALCRFFGSASGCRLNSGCLYLHVSSPGTCSLHGLNCLHIIPTTGLAICRLGHFNGLPPPLSASLLLQAVSPPSPGLPIETRTSSGSIPSVTAAAETGSVITVARARGSRKHPNAVKRARLRKREALMIDLARARGRAGERARTLGRLFLVEKIHNIKLWRSTNTTICRQYKKKTFENSMYIRLNNWSTLRIVQERDNIVHASLK